ncbi:hypothetical protein [Diaminobutyricimonas sp. LJ205]|uniref:hypothetical protein n=1 Tax=Diaminobutyricimonas sp. LJ205 TaxID=2683590 RepID=UPI0012F4B71C|nr:hypothetical protein [Diaminobutyricimonas sp. LJ205]
MPKIIPAPILLNDIVLSIGTDDYEASVSSAAIVPNNQTVTFPGMTPNGKKHVIVTDWTLNLTLAQDFATASSLSTYLRTNKNTSKEITLRPKAGGKGYKVTAVLAPGQIGGDGGTIGTAQVSLPCEGDPAEVVAG